MGVEGRDKQKILEAGALALSGQLGATVQRLRKAYNLSLAELSLQSGVAKSIISQIERNETNPTLATIWRLAHALDASIENLLQSANDTPTIRSSPVSRRKRRFRNACESPGSRKPPSTSSGRASARGSARMRWSARRASGSVTGNDGFSGCSTLRIA